MSYRRFSLPRAAWLCVVLCGLPLAVALAGDEAPKTLTQRMEREMLRLRVQLQNAQFRLEQGILGPFGDETASDLPQTPARSCCAINLRKMRGAVDELGVIFGEFATCHEAAGNAGTTTTVRFALNDLAQIAQGIEALAEAPTDEGAEGAVAGLVRAYVALLRTTEKIEACGPEKQTAPDPAAEENAKPKKKKKDKAKKKKAEEESGG